MLKYLGRPRKHSWIEVPKYGLLKRVTRILFLESKFREKCYSKECETVITFWKIVGDDDEGQSGHSFYALEWGLKALLLQLLFILSSVL